MNYKLLHIFRNTPFGRETFLQSLHFCKTIHASAVVYIPKTDKFLMYFSNDVVQINLDSSFLAFPETAHEHVIELFDQAGMPPRFYEPKNFTASTLPDISSQFDYMCSPRSISDLSSKIGLGHLGPKVRRMIKQATFPILIASPVFKEWNSVAVFFGGSSNAMHALVLGLKVAIASGFPLKIYTVLEKGSEDVYRDMVRGTEYEDLVDQYVKEWCFYESSEFERMLYEVPHDSLIVLGAYGHGVVKEILLGSKMEHIQSTVTNNLLVTGPNCRITLT
ncbi:universal stress protein [uncultured Desulfobacter sp.]|uniref:universal stress protein n=1 Tax=uncultured Desulfobacter sp. TaxID=240139 RepID=UPI002AAAF2A4|nr:universal stress protein [uncultured Desulfobacter sp.]